MHMDKKEKLDKTLCLPLDLEGRTVARIPAKILRDEFLPKFLQGPVAAQGSLEVGQQGRSQYLVLCGDDHTAMLHRPAQED